MKIKLNKVYTEDCLETLKKIDDNSIDCVVTSPPYNMNLRIRNGKYCSGYENKHGKKEGLRKAPL